ncbi:MAG: glycosyltransferase [Candidatus Roizmanbacteria bacterium]|nr:MAG: glycosyltransferase [Candidatus Roizmanbacteria bacterium]
MKKAAIVVPTYNEAGTIETLIIDIFEQNKKTPNWELHIVVVDSDSEDKTQEIVTNLIKKYPRLHLIKTKKEGLGKAYIEGFTVSIEKLNPYLIFEMDADLSHDPASIPNFLHKIEKGADFVIGSRYIKGGSIPENWGIHRKILSVVGNLIIKVGFMKPRITDWTSGYRAIKSWIVKEASPHIKNYSGYVFQVAFLDYALKKHAIVAETPINFKDRNYGVSKLNSFQTIFQTLLYVFTNSSFVKFVIVGAIGFVIDFGIFYFLTKFAHLVSWKANLISTETAVLSNFMLNNFWSFAHKKVDHNKKSYIKGFFKFNLVSSGNIIIQTVGVEILKALFGIKLLYIYKVAVIVFIVIPYSYFFYNKVIWKHKR